MALNSTGQISLGGATAGESIALELNLVASAQISLGDSAVKTLGGFASSSNVDMGSFRGKSNRVVISGSAVTFSTNSTETTINIGTLTGYIAGKTDVTVTINSGVYVYSTSTSTPALTIQGGSAGDTIRLVNNGYIMGKGGVGGTIQTAYTSGTAGGPALSIKNTMTVTNNGYIGGGGGGGRGGNFGGGGGGAGGGQGGSGVSGGGITNDAVGGAGGNPGATGGNGTQSGSTAYKGGGGGGRIMPGSGGAGGTNNVGSGGGAGGGAGCNLSGTGGSGGSGGATGGSPPSGYGGGGGGGWGASGGSGAAGGTAIVRNGYTVTTGGTGMIYGAIS